MKLNEEEIERKEIDRLRRRFPSNGLSYLPKEGYYDSPWWTEDLRKIEIRKDRDMWAW